MSAMRKVVLSASDKRIVRDFCDNGHVGGNKIRAIKHVRSHGRAIPRNEALPHPDAPSLREAKHIVEAMMGELDPTIKPSAVLGNGFEVKSIVVEIPGEGNIELDLDTLQMRFLQELSSLGLDEVQHLLKLTDFITDWQKG
jgi:hypothetical protein